MSFSAAPLFDEALVAAVSRFYGIEVDVPTAETEVLEDDFERVRFFPWFLWDFPLPSSSGDPTEELPFPTIGSRFLDEAELTDFERQVLRALVFSTLAFVEVDAVDPIIGDLFVTDLLGGRRLRVFDPGLASELQPGHIALIRLIRFDFDPVGNTVDDDEPMEDGAIDAIYAVLPHETRPLVEIELERLLGGAREPVAVLKTHAPELLDFAEHVLSGLTAPASPLNADREPIVLCQTVARGALAARLSEALGADASPFVPESGRVGHPDERISGLLVWREDERVVALAQCEGARVTLMASSRERYDRLSAWCASSGAPLPHLRSEAELDMAAHDWFARGETPPWLLDPDVARAFGDGLDRWLTLWPDQTHPAIAMRRPRDLITDTHGLEAVVRLVERVRRVAGDAAQVLDRWLAAEAGDKAVTGTSDQG
jgi:hypothetical protein